MKKDDVFYKLLYYVKIIAPIKSKVTIEFGIRKETNKPFLQNGVGIVEDGSIWTFYQTLRMISIKQFSLGKEDAQLNAREDNLGILESMFNYAPHYKDCTELLKECCFVRLKKRRRF